MYSSTTKNWFHTHPLFTLSRDEGPWSCFSPPEVELLVLEASHQFKQQPRKPNAVSNVQTPAIQEQVILIKKQKRRKDDEKKKNLDLHVFQKIHSDWTSFLLGVYTGSRKQGSLPTSLCEHFKVNPWDHKKIWNCLLSTQQVMKHIGLLPPAESMFVVQPFSLNNIWFLQFGCLPKSSETNRLFWEECGGYFTALIYSVKWKNKNVGEHPRVMVSVHFDWKNNIYI